MVVRFAGVLAALVGCGAPRAKPADPAAEPPPAEPPAEERGCSCERLNAPLEVPAQADERARWERTATQLAALETAIGTLFPRTIPCTADARAQIAELVAAHAHALGENAALNEATCDHFARWRFVRWPDRSASMRIVEAMRAGCIGVDGAALDQLVLTRGCTTVSLQQTD